MSQDQLKEISDELIRIKTVLWDVANELEDDHKKCASIIIFQEAEKIHDIAMSIIKGD